MHHEPTVFISHSSGSLPPNDICVLVKNALAAALDAKGWRVFLDSHALTGGDSWRTKILHSLATARAGVILLNKAASESPWVKAEALIMCFRKSIDPAFPLLPVILPGANVDKTFLKTYEPFQFNEIQQVTLALGDGESVEGFARRLADNSNLERGRQSRPSGTPWVQKVFDILGCCEHGVLCRAATKLQLELEPEALNLANREALCLRLRWALANLMHQRSAPECLEALKQMMGALSQEKATRLKPHLLSKWVENESAEMLFHSIREPEQQGLLALNTSRQTIIDRYTERLRTEMPPEGPIFWVFSVGQPNGDYDSDTLLRRVEQAINENLLPEPMYDDDGNELPLEVAIQQLLEPTNQFALAVLPPQYVTTALLKDLRRRFPRIILVALAGEQGQQTAECVAAGGRVLQPQLTAKKLNEFSLLLANWNALFRQYFYHDQT